EGANTLTLRGDFVSVCVIALSIEVPFVCHRCALSGKGPCAHQYEACSRNRNQNDRDHPNWRKSQPIHDNPCSTATDDKRSESNREKSRNGTVCPIGKGPAALTEI